jgi:ClpP class serine protease
MNMDVNMISSLSQTSAAVKASYSKSTTTTTNEATKETTTTTNEAYSLDISAEAQKASTALGKLTTEQVDTLKDGINKSYQLMIKTLTEQNAKLQAYLDDGIGQLNFDGILFGTDKFALPPVGTTPEEAAEAVGEGGAYSVDSVATRIMDMATAIAGGDPDKLRQMQSAVEEGFKQAGLVWKDAMGQDEMPQITKDTQNEITNRFNKLYEQMGIKASTMEE